MQHGVSRDPEPLSANLSASSITPRYRLKNRKSSHIYSSSSDDSSPSPPPPTRPKKRQLQLSKKQKVIHYRGLGLPAGTPPSLHIASHTTLLILIIDHLAATSNHHSHPAVIQYNPLLVAHLKFLMIQ